jgi:ligand-binding sensor domain-containing protein
MIISIVVIISPRKAFSLFLFFFTPLALFCQEDANYDYFSESNGFPANAVRAIAQDESGFIWIASSSGLVKYDGYDFRTFKNNPENSNSIMSDDVMSLLISSDGRIWLGYRTPGFSCFDPKKETFTH